MRVRMCSTLRERPIRVRTGSCRRRSTVRPTAIAVGNYGRNGNGRIDVADPVRRVTRLRARAADCYLFGRPSASLRTYTSKSCQTESAATTFPSTMTGLEVTTAR